MKLYYEGSRQKIGIISNRSGGNNIHSNGFIYSKHGCAKPDCILWYCCYRDSCKGKMITTLDYAEQRKGVLKIEHSHEPDFE